MFQFPLHMEVLKSVHLQAGCHTIFTSKQSFSDQQSTQDTALLTTKSTPIHVLDVQVPIPKASFACAPNDIMQIIGNQLYRNGDGGGSSSLYSQVCAQMCVRLRARSYRARCWRAHCRKDMLLMPGFQYLYLMCGVVNYLKYVFIAWKK